MILIGLLRHGEVEGGSCFRGHTDDPLSRTGWDQMKTATDGGHHWDRIVTSPLDRCAAFARDLARRRAVPFAVDERLTEMHFGAWEGRTAAELMAEDANALTGFWQDPAGHPPPGGEPLSHFQARVLAAWDSIIHGDSGQRVLVVTHGGVIRVLLCHVLQRPIAKLLEFEVRHAALYNLRISVDAKQAPGAELVGQV